MRVQCENASMCRVYSPLPGTKPQIPSSHDFDHLLNGREGKSFFFFNEEMCLGSPGGPVVKNPPASAGGLGSIPGLGRSHMLQSGQACEP